MSVSGDSRTAGRQMAPHVVGDAGGGAAVRRGAGPAGGSRGDRVTASARWPRTRRRRKLARVYAVEHELLEDYTADGYTAALEELIRKVNPSWCLFPHTYQVRDFAPKLATRFDQVLVSDVIAARVEAGSPVFVRQLFQGKLNGDVRVSGSGPCFASLQAGAWRADALESGSARGRDISRRRLIDRKIRQKPEAPFRESARAVDLTAAEIIVSVGRGIKEKENIPVVEELAQGAGRGTGGLASDLRRGLAADGAAGGQLRPDRGAEDVHGGRDFRRDPAPGGDEGREDHRRDQQGCERADFRGRRLRHRRAICSRWCRRWSRK